MPKLGHVCIVIGLLWGLSACAPNTMGGAETAEVVGSPSATYDASPDAVFGVVQDQAMRAVGWTVAASDAQSRFLRIEQVTTRARLFAAPLDVTEFAAFSVSSGDAEATSVVTVEHTDAAEPEVRNVLDALDAEFGTR